MVHPREPLRRGLNQLATIAHGRELRGATPKVLEEYFDVIEPLYENHKATEVTNILRRDHSLRVTYEIALITGDCLITFGCDVGSTNTKRKFRTGRKPVGFTTRIYLSLTCRSWYTNNCGRLALGRKWSSVTERAR